MHPPIYVAVRAVDGRWDGSGHVVAADTTMVGLIAACRARYAFPEGIVVTLFQAGQDPIEWLDGAFTRREHLEPLVPGLDRCRYVWRDDVVEPALTDG